MAAKKKRKAARKPVRKARKTGVKARKSAARKSPLARAAKACKGKKAYKTCFKKMIKKFKKK
jgi:hypothetical protein